MTLHNPVDLASLETARDRWDAAIEWLLIGLLGFMPLAFGAVEAWSEMVVILAAAAMSICLAVKLLLRRDFRIVWTWTYVPIALFLLLAVFQLFAFPRNFIALLSPQTVATKMSLLSDLADEPGLRSTTLSFYPNATKHDLRLAMVAAAVFFVVVNVYRHPRQIKRLLAAIAAVGGALAVVALLQIVTGATRIYWTVETPAAGVTTAGSFVNHSHYAQFMNLSVGAALGLLLVRWQESTRHGRRAFAGVRSWASSLRSPRLGWIAAMIVLGVVTVATSLSRNGVISMLVAAVLTGMALASRPNLRWRTWFVAIVLLVAFAGLLQVGFDAVYDRLATLQDLGNDGRWEMNLCSLAAWRHYPVWGTGLGTYAVVFPMFDTSTTPALAAHADNDYAQTLEETGLVGVAFLTAFLIGIGCIYFRLIRRGKTTLAVAAFGLGFGLLAVMIHSMTDFGQHLPANFCLSAVGCGLLVCLARIEHDRSTGPDVDKVRLAGPGKVRWLGAPALAGLVAVWGWAIFEANAARVAERNWAEALVVDKTLREADWEGSDKQYADLITRAAAAAENQPDNVEYRYWLGLYRWYSISRNVDPATGQVVLHLETVPFVERIADDLAEARVLCPTFGPVYSVEGQLKLFVLGRAEGGGLIRKGYRLAPYDAPTCFIAGVYASQEGDLEEAASRFKRAVALDGSFYDEVLEIYVHELNRPDLARELAAGDWRRLLQLSRSLSDIDKDAAMAEEVHGEAVAILRKKCDSPDATGGELATMAGICLKDDDFASAVAYYRRALNLNYGQVGWRLALANALAETGQEREAVHEARICLRLRPQMESARRLIEKLVVQSPK